MLRGIFQEALYDEVIEENIAMKLRKPKLKKPEIEPFTLDEIDRIIRGAVGWFKHLIQVGFYTGMRTGEIVALKWEDVDFEAKTIYVRRTEEKAKKIHQKQMEVCVLSLSFHRS